MELSPTDPSQLHVCMTVREASSWAEDGSEETGVLVIKNPPVVEVAGVVGDPVPTIASEELSKPVP